MDADKKELEKRMFAADLMVTMQSLPFLIVAIVALVVVYSAGGR